MLEVELEDTVHAHAELVQLSDHVISRMVTQLHQLGTVSSTLIFSSDPRLVETLLADRATNPNGQDVSRKEYGICDKRMKSGH